MVWQAREKDATVGEKKLGMEMAETLKGMIAPYFLRRTKAEVKEKEQEAKEKEDQDNVTHAVYVNSFSREAGFFHICSFN